jgi:hypothetical protein
MPTRAPWSDFPPSLRADLQGWLGRLAGDDLFEELLEDEGEESALDAGPGRPARPITLRHREYQVRQFASALVASGVDPAALQQLADLVRPNRMKIGIQFYLDRHGGKPTAALPGLVGGLQAIARHWVKAPPEDLQQIAKWLRRIRQKVPNRGGSSGGMTPKNRDRLRPLDAEPHVRALLRLPLRLVNLAEGAVPSEHRAALLMQTAVAIEILLMAPLRIRNLAALDIKRHLYWLHRYGGGSASISLDAGEVKNHHDLE